MKKCIHCGHAVSKGDRHALESCPPSRGKRRRRKKNRTYADVPQRGVTVPGTGVPKGASK